LVDRYRQRNRNDIETSKAAPAARLGMTVMGKSGRAACADPLGRPCQLLRQR
jgi:hypothetical protein